ncbi:Clp protease N-terminal domain-containing protein [Actinoplanes sp. NBRC 101535]|uniref:Clp protease N-terminal domain-containing protein n=1 Tax=Actinoplanes sp. NBRC 101535 TaxID=3032196 RepID=UPI0024A36881|nr:Clp protease N-terminal domain-containing protein [Actinoplanes sp. NBRC 101535]GLY05430.1 hypothetical protein Acsp01_58090 [Actinoplanes sp. NBRC 101535]
MTEERAMTDALTIGDRLTNTLARVRGLSNGPISTGHLLYSVACDKEAGALLDAFDITPRALLAVLRTPGRISAEPGVGPIWDPETERNDGPFDGFPTVKDAVDHVLVVSHASDAALRAGTGDNRMTLLAALLEDPAADASALIRDCRADPDQVRRAVLGGRIPELPDRLPPALRPARDALLGRIRYRGRGLRDKLLLSVFAREANHADQPVLWARLEADERAREQRRSTRTDDLLLALLVTHEVMVAYPHMAAASADRFGGGADLLAEGVDHEKVRVVTVGDQPDEVPAEDLLRPGPNWPENTRILLERLRAHPGNRSARVLAALQA